MKALILMGAVALMISFLTLVNGAPTVTHDNHSLPPGVTTLPPYSTSFRPGECPDLPCPTDLPNDCEYVKNGPCCVEECMPWSETRRAEGKPAAYLPKPTHDSLPASHTLAPTPPKITHDPESSSPALPTTTHERSEYSPKSNTPIARRGLVTPVARAGPDWPIPAVVLCRAGETEYCSTTAEELKRDLDKPYTVTLTQRDETVTLTNAMPPKTTTKSTVVPHQTSKPPSFGPPDKREEEHHSSGTDEPDWPYPASTGNTPDSDYSPMWPTYSPGEPTYTTVKRDVVAPLPPMTGLTQSDHRSTIESTHSDHRPITESTHAQHHSATESTHSQHRPATEPTHAQHHPTTGLIQTVDCYSLIPSDFQDKGPWAFQNPRYCLSQCSGFSVMAITGGSTCYCGNELPSDSDKTSVSSCNTPCQGFRTQSCGGTNVYQLYLTGTGTPGPAAGVDNSPATESSHSHHHSTTESTHSHHRLTSFETRTKSVAERDAETCNPSWWGVLPVGVSFTPCAQTTVTDTASNSGIVPPYLTSAISSFLQNSTVHPKHTTASSTCTTEETKRHPTSTKPTPTWTTHLGYPPKNATLDARGGCSGEDCMGVTKCSEGNSASSIGYCGGVYSNCCPDYWPALQYRDWQLRCYNGDSAQGVPPRGAVDCRQTDGWRGPEAGFYGGCFKDSNFPNCGPA